MHCLPNMAEIRTEIRIMANMKSSGHCSQTLICVEGKITRAIRRQLLRLMYIHSKNQCNIKVPLRRTSAMNKKVFNRTTRCSGKYLNSPFYKGTLLWNALSPDLQKAGNVIVFVRELKKMDVRYQETL